MLYQLFQFGVFCFDALELSKVNGALLNGSHGSFYKINAACLCDVFSQPKRCRTHGVTSQELGDRKSALGYVVTELSTTAKAVKGVARSYSMSFGVILRDRTSTLAHLNCVDKDSLMGVKCCVVREEDAWQMQPAEALCHVIFQLDFIELKPHDLLLFRYSHTHDSCAREHTLVTGSAATSAIHPRSNLQFSPAALCQLVALRLPNLMHTSHVSAAC